MDKLGQSISHKRLLCCASAEQSGGTSTVENLLYVAVNCNAPEALPSNPSKPALVADLDAGHVKSASYWAS
jgi:hypothetical protein